MIDFNIEKIAPLCLEFGVEITEDIKNKLNTYGNLLLEWNEKINLTAIKEPDAVLYKHFYDCILFLKHNNLPENSTLIDVGTGAGFPGMVLKIVRPDLEITLLDSLNKRLIFLNEVIDKLALTGIETVHSRAEDAGKNPAFREKYDFATARAVAELRVLLEYTLPFVKVGGSFLSLKGATAKEEIDGAGNSLKTLGGKIEGINNFTLPGGDKRAIIKVKKISQSSPKYPRPSAQIAKKPL